jgi:hypothetical protein
MGILDDAIKEHLDLKRRHGADDSEVKRLEDEAFGPATRPGEPDFPESEEQPVLAADVLSGESPADGEASGAETGAEDATTVLDSDEAPVESPPEEAADTGAFYDQSVGEEEPAGHEEPPAEELSAEEHPIAGLETEEHPVEEESADETAVEPPAEPEPPATDEESLPEEGEPEPPVTDEEPAEGASPATDPEDEDVLEGTPEFLRDQPEDEELWFEQGEPKDFDF